MGESKKCSPPGAKNHSTFKELRKLPCGWRAKLEVGTCGDESERHTGAGSQVAEQCGWHSLSDWNVKPDFLWENIILSAI